jgi:hypothetical protein
MIGFSYVKIGPHFAAVGFGKKITIRRRSQTKLPNIGVFFHQFFTNARKFHDIKREPGRNDRFHAGKTWMGGVREEWLHRIISGLSCIRMFQA